MRFTTITGTITHTPKIPGNEDGTLTAVIRPASVRDVDAISVQLAASVPSEQMQAELQTAVLRAHVVEVRGLEIDGAFVANIDTLLEMRDRLPAAAASLFGDLFVACLGGPSLDPRPSSPRST